MPKYSEQTDRVKRITLEPEITRAFWSKRRAWHGDELKLTIETRHVPDGTPVTVEIWEDDSGEGSPDDFIARIPDEHTVEGGRCVIDYRIEWDEEALGAELKLEGGNYEFYFKVKTERFQLKKRSNLLYVDLSSFRFSA